MDAYVPSDSQARNAKKIDTIVHLGVLVRRGRYRMENTVACSEAGNSGSPTETSEHFRQKWEWDYPEKR